MKTTLSDTFLEKQLEKLSNTNQEFKDLYPGESTKRQPVHTVYGGAHLFKAGTCKKMGEVALRTLDAYAPDAKSLILAMNLHDAAHVDQTLYERVIAKLKNEPIEDFRIDFEDGFGNRPDEEEDAVAVTAAEQTALGMKEGVLSPFIGIRIKTLTDDLKRRAFRTLDIYLTTLLEQTGGKLPDNFVVTLPKVTDPDHVEALVNVFEEFEDRSGLAPGSLKMEVMVETTQSILDKKGRAALPAIVKEAKGRCTGAHFGTYDYTASVGITADHQTMDHSACDFARHVMKVTLSGTGIFLSDGATNIMPIGPHRGENLSDEQRQENIEVVHRAWQLGSSHVRHSLKNGYYQGWDLHPAQLPVRYATCGAFFLSSLAETTDRLKNFIDKAAQATLVGDVFDDAATGQGLLNFFLRGMSCGALTEKDVLATGLTLEELESRSFLKVMENRRK